MRTAEYAASRLRRAGEQRRELLHDLDALLMRVITQVGRDGRRTYPGLAKWCVQLGTTDRKKAGSIKTTSRVTEWPMGILSRVPLPPFTETAFWDHTAWLPPERKAFDELRGRFANIATARREAVEYLERAGVCGHCRTDIKQTASAVASVGGRPAGEPTAIKKVSVSNSSSDVKAQQTSRTLPFGASRVGESEEDKPNQFSVHYVALEPSERLSRISGQQPRYNDEDWVTNDGCPHEYRHPGNLKCRLRQGAEEYTFPKPEGASQPVGILNWKRHHRKCTQWNKEKLSPKRPEYVFVNEQYGAGHADGSGYAPQEGDNEGGNLKLGVPKGFNAAAPSETDLAFWRDLQQYNAAEIQSDRLRWADPTEYGGSTKLVSHHNRLTRGNDEDLMLMAVRAFAIWNGTHGPNQPKYCNPQALGNASNRGRRSGGGVGQEYTFSSFKQFLTESQTSTYWSNDHYYRKTHLHLGPGVTEPSLSDHAPPWRDLARKRTAAEAWRLFYDAQTTLGENHALTGARATMIRLDPYPWQAWCPAHANVALTFTRSRVEVTHPSARVLPPPRRRARIPRDMYDKAHLVDGPNVPPSSRDADILRQASAQAVATDAREGGEPSKLDSEPHDDLRPEDDGIRVFAGASPPNGAPLSTAQQAACSRYREHSNPHYGMHGNSSNGTIQCDMQECNTESEKLTSAPIRRNIRNGHSESMRRSGELSSVLTSPEQPRHVDEAVPGTASTNPQMKGHPSALVDMELLERAASAGLTRRVAAALPQHAVRTVSDGQVQYEMVSRKEAAKLHDSFSSDGFAMVDETVLPDCSVEVGNDGQLLRLRIHGEGVNALWDPLRSSADHAAAELLLDTATVEELQHVADSIMYAACEPPHEEQQTEDKHIHYKPEDAVSMAQPVPNKTVLSPGATPEHVAAIDREHPGPGAGSVHSLLQRMGVTEKHFIAEFSEWDKQHAARFQYRPSGEPPPQEHRRIARGLLEAVAEQLRAFMKAGWIYRVYEAETCAPIVVVPKKDGTVRITIDYSSLNSQLRPRAWSMPDVNDTIHGLRDMAKESYRQIKANRNGSRATQADDDPDSGSRAGISVDQLEDPGMSRLGKTDIQKAFHRILVDERDRANLTFSAPQLGLFTWRVLPMGASSSPAAFCSVSTKMLERAGVVYNPGGCDPVSVREYLLELYNDMQQNDWLIDGFELRDGELYIDGYLAPSQFATVYVDDITTVSAAPEGSFDMPGDGAAMHEHVRQWKLLIAVCRHQRIFLAGPKTCVGCEIIRLLGLCVSHTDIFADPDRVKALADIPEPTTKSDVRCYCGLGNWYRNFCELFAVTLAPIYELTKDDVPDKDVTAHFSIPLPADDERAATHFGVLADEGKHTRDGRYSGRLIKRKTDKSGKAHDISCREAWQLVKDRMCELTLQAQPDISKPMTIFTDSSQYAGAGAIAMEVSPGKLRVFDVWSKNFTETQRNYSASEREALSLVMSVKHWYTWICVSKFTVCMRTDHMAVIHARQKINNARITSWFAQLAALDFNISYVRGTSPLMLVPDALSRLVQRYTEKEIAEQWVDGEHFLKVPCFEKIYRRLNPEQPIHTYRGVDTYDPPIDAVQTAQESADAADIDDSASDVSDVFEYDEPWQRDQLIDDEELEMHQFAADTAAKLGGGIVRGVSAPEFFKRRQQLQAQAQRDAQQIRLMETAAAVQADWVFDTVVPSASDYLERVVAVTTRNQAKAATTSNQSAPPQKSKADKSTQPSKQASASMAKGVMGELNGEPVFIANYNSTFASIARRFGLDPDTLLYWNKQRQPQHPWPQDRTCARGTTRAIDVKLQRSTVFLSPTRATKPPRDLRPREERPQSTPTPAPTASPSKVQPVDTATEQLLKAAYGHKAMHGEMNPAEKRWGLSKESYQDSAEFGELFKKLGRMRPGSTTKQEPRRAPTKDGKPGKLTVIGTYHGTFCRKQNRLYYLQPRMNQWLIVIPEGDCRQALLKEFHAAFQTHPSASVQYEVMRKRVWWPGMAKACTDFVKHCEHCQRFKHQTHKQGKHAMIEEPATFGDTYHLDLIDSLPVAGARNWDAALVITDRMSRRTWITPCHKTLTGKQAAEIFFNRIVCTECRGAARRLVSDRGPQFVSHLWQQLHALMGTSVILSSGHEHNLNAMSERHIASVETLLRGESWDPTRWLTKVRLAEFAMNANPRPSLGGRCPIEIETGHIPHLPLDLSDEVLAMRKKHPVLDEHLRDLRLLWAEVNESMQTVKDIEKGRYDRHRDSWEDKIQAGDRVLLKSKDLSLPINEVRGNPKMSEKYYGPYTVLGFVAPQTVTLKLPPHSRVHPNFSVAKLKPYHGDPGASVTPLPEPDPDQQHEIEDILLHRQKGDKIEYLVRWKHYGPEDASWVPQQDVKADRLIAKYQSRRKILREYNEAATTTEDAMLFAVLGTVDAAITGAHVPTLYEALLPMQEEAIFWCATTKHPYLNEQ